MSGAQRVLVAMSGGVDSTAAVALLLEEGFEVVGVTMRLQDAGQEADIVDARAACQRFGIEHQVVDLRERFEAQVVHRFCTAYLCGQTPNPCVTCNRYIKFAALHELRRQQGFDYLATGHYVRRAFDAASDRWQLVRARDKAKDQSYFLFSITQDQLAHTLFPLGDLTKEEARVIARDAGLPMAEKAESQDICFVSQGDHVAFIAQRAAGDVARLAQAGVDVGCDAACDAACATMGAGTGDHGAHEIPGAFLPGPIVDRAGRVLGEHPGLIHFTAGQRKGIGVAAPEPLYVMEKRPDTRELVVGTAAEATCTSVMAADANAVSVVPWKDALPVQVKTHYRQQPQPAMAEVAGDSLCIAFAEPQRVCAPGQAAVVYDGDILLAGGTIVSCA